MTERRKRGRPKGASRYKEQDAQTIRSAALLLARGEVKNRTVAFRRVGATDESDIRRLMRGWNTDQRGEKAMVEAHQRIEVERRSRNRAVTSGDVRSAMGAMNRIMETTRTFERIANFGRSPAMEAILEHQKRMQDLVDPPTLRAIRKAGEATRSVSEMMRTLGLPKGF